MKKEVLVVLECGELVDSYCGADWVNSTKGYVFDDYEKARYWVLAWVMEYNKGWKRTVRGASGEFEEIHEPVLKEVTKDVWACFAADIQIYRIGDIDIESMEASDRIYLS